MAENTSLESPVPMLNVRDIEKTIDWYKSLGFEVIETSKAFKPEEEPLDWAYLKRDGAALMFNLDPNSKHLGQSVTFYMNTNNVDDFYKDVKDKVTIIDDICDQFYGMRDFYFKDLNGFKFGVGQPIKN